LYKLSIAATVEGESLTGEYQFQVAQRDLEAADVLANGQRPTAATHRQRNRRPVSGH
jgi:hypothetical protein